MSAPAQAPLHPADNRTFYRDIDASPEASQEQILTAAVHSLYRLCGFEPNSSASEPSHHPTKPEIAARSQTVLAAFSTLYGVRSRAAYDKFGDSLFGFLAINSHAASNHPTIQEFGAKWKQTGYIMLATTLTVGASVLYLSRFTPGTAKLFALPLVVLLGSGVISAAKTLSGYLHLSSTGEIAQADAQLISAIDSTREPLVRLYGTQAAFGFIPRVMSLGFFVVAFVVLGLDFFSIFWHPLIMQAYWLLIPAIIVESSSSFAALVSNSGFIQPNLDIFFHTAAARVNTDLPSLSAANREKVLGFIDAAVYKARMDALLSASSWFPATAAVICFSYTWSALWWVALTYVGAWIVTFVLVNTSMFAFKSRWSYEASAQRSSA